MISPTDVRTLFLVYVGLTLVLSIGGAIVLARRSGSGFFSAWFKMNWRLGLGAGLPGALLFSWVIAGGAVVLASMILVRGR